MLSGGDRVNIIYEDLTFVFRPASVLEANSLVVVTRGTGTRVGELDVVCHCTRSLSLVLIVSTEAIDSSLIYRCSRVTDEVINIHTTEYLKVFMSMLILALILKEFLADRPPTRSHALSLS